VNNSWRQGVETLGHVTVRVDLLGDKDSPFLRASFRPSKLSSQTMTSNRDHGDLLHFGRGAAQVRQGRGTLTGWSWFQCGCPGLQ